jgi:hypothetical protein
MNCEYCGANDQKEKNCSKCGAPIPEKKQDVWKSEPFFYNGYICYTMRDYATDTAEVQFWLGRELIERIVVPLEIVRQRVPDGYDAMGFFWDLFLVAHGEKDVLEWKEKNDKYPASFEVRRIENPEKVRWLSLSMYDIVSEARR